jgi:hypothetical protein
VVSNQTLNASKRAYYLTRKIQSFISGAKSGRWHVVVVAQNPVGGTAFDEPFKGQVSFVAVPVDRGGLPSSTADGLTRGSPETFMLAVTNPGVQPIYVGTDPRLHRTVTLQPVPIQGNSSITLPANPALEPIYNIPPNTSSFTVAAVSTTPAQLELQGSAAGFDVFGDLAEAQNGDLLSVASVSEAGHLDTITKGAWFTNMQQIGPFTDAGPPPGETTFTASMQTLAFDNAVTSSTRDPYANSIDPNSNGFGRPVRIAPGATENIAVTITPNAPVNTNVSGLLNLVTVPNLTTGSNGLPVLTTGEVIARVQYAYHVTG